MVQDGSPNVIGTANPPVSLSWRPTGGAFQTVPVTGGGAWSATVPATADEIQASYGDVPVNFSASFAVRAGIPANDIGRDGQPIPPDAPIRNCVTVAATGAHPPLRLHRPDRRAALGAVQQGAHLGAGRGSWWRDQLGHRARRRRHLCRRAPAAGRHRLPAARARPGRTDQPGRPDQRHRHRVPGRADPDPDAGRLRHRPGAADLVVARGLHTAARAVGNHHRQLEGRARCPAGLGRQHRGPERHQPLGRHPANRAGGHHLDDAAPGLQAGPGQPRLGVQRLRDHRSHVTRGWCHLPGGDRQHQRHPGDQPGRDRHAAHPG